MYEEEKKDIMVKNIEKEEEVKINLEPTLLF